jgi:hypothetical protein
MTPLNTADRLAAVSMLCDGSASARICAGVVLWGASPKQRFFMQEQALRLDQTQAPTTAGALDGSPSDRKVTELSASQRIPADPCGTPRPGTSPRDRL